VRRLGSRLATAAIVAFAWMPVPKAAAQASPPPLAERLTGAAREDYEAGRLLLSTHDDVGAMVRFRRAYRQTADPRLLANMALCEKNMLHYGRAATLFQRALDEGGALFTPAQVEQVRAMIAECVPRTGLLRIAVDIPGATVRVDDEPAGSSPLAADVRVDRGNHRVAVTLAGYRPFVRDVPVADDKPVPVEVHLERQMPEGIIVVRAPVDAAVALDGHVVGKGVWQGRVAAGTHAVRVTADGMSAYEGDVDIVAEQRRTVDVTLQRDRGSPVWLWIAGGAVAVVAVVVASAAVFHSSDSGAAGDAPATTVLHLSW
jgi:hypothetical protein